jgi:hypothetical protein
LYGTQFTVTDGEHRPRPIEDPQQLDERRAEAGLDPFADYEAECELGHSQYRYRSQERSYKPV